MIILCVPFLAPGDYNSAPVVMTFMPGDMTKNFSIPIVNDAAVENPERFIISLTSTDPSAAFGPDGTMLIFDDDNSAGEICTE